MPIQARQHPRVPTLTTGRGIAVGILAIAALTGLKLLFPHALGYPTPYLLYFGAAMAAAWSGDLAAGIVVTLVGAAVAHLVFVAPTHGVTPETFVGTSVFLLEGALISLLTARTRRASIASAGSSERATAALEQLRAVIEAVGEGVTMQDAQGHLVFANETAAKMAGFDSADAMVATSQSERAQRIAILRDDGSPFPLDELPGRVALREGAAEAQLVGFRFENTQELRWSLIRANAVRDAAGAIRYVVNCFQDITDRRRDDEALKVSREWFRVALRSIGDAVVTTDAAGRVTFLNAVAEELTGWPQHDADGRALDDVFQILDETTRNTVESPVMRVLRERVVVGLANHTILVRRDGTERSIDDSAAPITTDTGELVGVVLVFRDVSATRRRETRKAFLMRATAELNSSLDYEATLATVARLAVPAIADWCAVDMRADGVTGHRRLAVAHVDPHKMELVKDIERRYPPDPNAATGVPNVLRTGEGEMLTLIPPELLDAAALDEAHGELIRKLALRSYIAVPIKHGGRTLGAISLVMAESMRTYDAEDFTFAMALGERAAVAIENATLYRDASRLRDQAEAASRSKDEFLAMLGHELRNPLAPIVTALELMDEEEAPFERERTIIKRQLDHVTRLVDDLLDVSRIMGGKVSIKREIAAVRAIVDRALEMAGPMLEQREHHVSIELEPDLVVDGDPTRLAQVLANLLQNGAKYTEPRGHVSVRAWADGTDVVLLVKDDGVGIAADMLPRVFDLFAQESQNIDRSRGGLGIGLAIVRGIVSQHGGTTVIRSEGVGHGTEAEVRVPARPGAEKLDAPLVAVPTPTPTNGARVLIVDDNDDARELLGVALARRGFRPILAADGVAALDLAAKEPPDIVLLDIGLPVIDGYEVARRMRALPGLRDVRFVALTGYGQDSDRAKAREHGFQAHLTKPVDLNTLVTLLSDLVSS